MIFKIFGRWVQVRAPVKIYKKKEAILVETADEITTMFGKPNVQTAEFDASYRAVCRLSDTPSLFVHRKPEI